MHEVYVDRGNLHLVLFPLSICHGHLKNHGGPGLLLGWGSIIWFDFCLGSGPKRKRNTEISDFRSPEVNGKTKIDELYKKVNPWYRSNVGMSFLYLTCFLNVKILYSSTALHSNKSFFFIISSFVMTSVWIPFLNVMLYCSVFQIVWKRSQPLWHFL